MLEILREKFEPLFLIASKNACNEEVKQRKKETSQTCTDENAKTNLDEQMNEKKTRKNKAKNIILLKKVNPEYGKGSINPISRLIQIQQAKKEHEPIFEPVKPEEDKLRRRTEFTIQCTIEPTAPNTEVLKSEGKGSTKKLAKQKAAESMLLKLGYQTRSPSALKPSIKSTNENPTSKEDSNKISELSATCSDKTVEKKVKFLDQDLLSEQLRSTKLETNTDNYGRFYYMFV